MQRREHVVPRRVRLAVLALALGMLAFPASASAAARTKAAMPSDFNGDGHADLAIGMERATVGSERGAGAVEVLYGSRKGVTAAGDQRWTQHSRGIKGTSEGCRRHDCDDEGDAFGSALASADFDRDGYADLAIGVPFDRVGTVDDAGAVNVLYGSRSGLTAHGDQRWSLGNLPGAPGFEGRFGERLAAGDVDGDGYPDLAVAVPGDSTGGTLRAGSVRVLRGGPGGLSSKGATIITRDLDGQASFEGQLFGPAVALGDIDADGYADLAIGTPDLGCNSPECAINGGEIAVYYGSAEGPGAVRRERWTEDSPGIVDRSEAEDYLGDDLVIGDFDADGFGDLAAGASREDVADCGPYCLGPGAVLVIYGSADGLVAERSELWHEDAPGVPGAGQDGGYFGWRLAAGDFDGDGADELVVGSPIKGKGAYGAGQVLVLRGVPGTGLTADGASSWSQATPGVPGVRRARHWFGSAVAVADYGKSGRADLAIGVPGDGHGRVIILFGRSTGLSAKGAQSWSPATPGVKGSAHRSDAFGSSLSP